MTTSEAWLLQCDNSLAIAVGEHEMVEFLQQQELHVVPGAPGYCSRVLIWQDNIVPVMDVAALHHGIVAEGEISSFSCLLNYQKAPNLPLQQLALNVSATPRRIRVDDEQVCELPEHFDSSPLKSLVLCSFVHDDHQVLILDIAKLCSAEFREIANAA